MNKNKVANFIFYNDNFCGPKICTLKSKTRLFSNFAPNLELSRSNGVWKWLAQHMAGMAENRYFLHIFRNIVKKKKKFPYLGKLPLWGSVYCIPMEGGRAEENFFLSEKKKIFKVFLRKNKSCPEATNACCDLPWPSRCQMYFFFCQFFSGNWRKMTS